MRYPWDTLNSSEKSIIRKLNENGIVSKYWLMKPSNEQTTIKVNKMYRYLVNTDDRSHSIFVVCDSVSYIRLASELLPLLWGLNQQKNARLITAAIWSAVYGDEDLESDLAEIPLLIWDRLDVCQGFEFKKYLPTMYSLYRERRERDLRNIFTYILPSSTEPNIKTVEQHLSQVFAPSIAQEWCTESNPIILKCPIPFESQLEII